MGGKPMKIFSTLLLLLLTLPLNSSASLGNYLPDLERTGEGTIRWMGIFKVYDAALYTSKNLQAETILADNISKCLVLNYDLDLSANDIIKGANVVLERQNSAETLLNLKEYIDILHNNYTDVKSGDSYTLCYDADSQLTTLLYNNAEVVKIDSPEFARLYFAIWLGEQEPISSSLRTELLGK